MTTVLGLLVLLGSAAGARRWTLYARDDGRFFADRAVHRDGLLRDLPRVHPAAGPCRTRLASSRRRTAPRARVSRGGLCGLSLNASCVVCRRQPPQAIGLVTARLAATNGVALSQNSHASRAEWFEYPAAIHGLPAAALVANRTDRETNYALLGNRLGNHLLDSAEVNRRFGGANDALHFTRQAVAASGVTHLYITSNRTLTTDDGVKLKPVDRLDRNPFNGQPSDAPHVLHEIERLGPAAGR